MAYRKRHHNGLYHSVALAALWCCALALVVVLTRPGLVAGSAQGQALPTIDLGDIPSRPVAPHYPFERFFQTRPLDNLTLAPDGHSAFFLQSDGRVANVFALALEDGTVRQVTRLQEPVDDFLLAHGGRFLILTQDRQGNESYDLYLWSLASGQVSRLTRSGEGDRALVCGLSPDDRVLYYAQTRDQRREAGLWRLELATGQRRELLPGEGRTLECDGVSADGRFLLYAELIGFEERRLHVLDLEDGRRFPVSVGRGVNDLDGSFAGDQVYFRSAWGADRFRIWRYRIGGPPATPVSLPVEGDIQAFSLFGDGRIAVVEYRTELSSRTAILSQDFSVQERFGLPGEEFVEAVFSKADAAVGIVALERASMPRRYYRVGRGPPALVYDANVSGIDPEHFAEARSVRVPSFDGLEVPLHLFIPNGTSAAHPRPVLVYLHGGPLQHVDPLYSSAVQYLANRGFIVAVPNVRGSTGFGKRYAGLDNGDWGGGHVRDVVAVADFLRGLDFVDGDNLFLAGISFGGFSVLSLITQYPETFRAAVDLFGFSELASFVDSWPPFLRRHVLIELGFDPRHDPVRNRLRSPLYHIDQIRIPLQVHQGANDNRVPREQSDRLVQRLRSLDRPVEYFVYADEGHGFSRFANQELAYERMLKFLQRHLSSAERTPESLEPPRRQGRQEISL